MKNNQKGISLLIIVILLLALAVVSIFGYYAYLKFFKTPSINTNTAEVVTPSVEPKPTAAALSSIPLGNHTTFGFSFQAPINAAVMQPNAEGFRIIYFGPKQSKENNSPFSDGYIIIIRKFGAINLDTAVEQGRLKASDTCSNPTVSPVTTATFAGQTAKTYSYTCTNVGGVEYFISNAGNVYQITNESVGDSASIEGYKVITGKIISSFKFVQ